MPSDQVDMLSDDLKADADVELRNFLGRVYLKIAAGLVLSATIAGAIFLGPQLRRLFVAISPAGEMTLTWAGLALITSPMLFLVAANFLVRDPTGKAAGVVFCINAALIGGASSLLAVLYTGAALVSTFLVAAAAFASLALWGFIARQTLRSLEAFLSLTLSGLVIALIVNIVLQSPVIDLVINTTGVLIFSGLLAIDTRRLRNIYHESTDPAFLAATSNFGALSLYLNIVNLFELLLLFVTRRSRR